MLLAVATWSAVSCAPPGQPHINFPAGAGSPAPDYAPAFAAALQRCRDVRTFSAALALSGRVGRQKLRGRVLAGLAPAALRLEALAPGGSPAFILIADGPRGRLLLARDRRILDNAPPAEILDALVGIALAPDDLRAMLSGCVQASVDANGARAYGTDWIAVDLAAGGTTYLRRGADGGWRVAAGVHAGLTIEYGGLAGGAPAQMRITSPASAGRPEVDITISLSQVEVNGDLPRDQLTALTVAPGTSPITLQELRESYHR
jgi:hypothetical protein